MKFWRAIRVLVLLSVLLVVAVTQCQSRVQLAAWDRTLWVTIHPIVADDTPAVRSYIDSLSARSFVGVNNFLMREGLRYGVPLQQPVQFQIAETGDTLPPRPPYGGSTAAIAIWSLKARWWAWRQSLADDLPDPDIRMFVLFHSVDSGQLRETSVGMQKGAYGVVHAHATRAGSAASAVLFTHELLHVLGASDKYHPQTGQPSVPEGLGDPDQSPQFPQRVAEIMGGRVALTPTHSERPASLRSCVVGVQTAIEIGWR